MSQPIELRMRMARFIQGLEWGADQRCPCCRATKRQGHQTIVSTEAIWIENTPCPMAEMLGEIKASGLLHAG